MNTFTFYRPNAIQNIMGEFDNYFGSLDSLLAPAARIFNHTPIVDFRETDNAYIMDMELPGYDEKNINVHVNGFNLTIASKQEDQKENKAGEDKDNYLIKERRTNSFSHSFKLPENADTDTVNAAFKNGVLSLEIKKRAEAQKRVIQINAA
jgi:HSP20 family protein